MKKILLSIVTCLAFFTPVIVKAQATFTTSDTIYATVDASSSIYDTLTITSASSVSIKWRISSCNFPADWRTSAALGVCDNNRCYNNDGITNLWNGFSGSSFTSNPYSPGAGSFDAQLNLTSASAGTYYMTINMVDTASSTAKTLTYIITRQVESSVRPVQHTDDIVFYPNPASSEVNVVYDASADVKNIAIYNIIGKIITVYKVSSNNGANLNIDNLPSGIYFARLMDSHGAVVATKKFTKQ